jgi:hypothetical protein
LYDSESRYRCPIDLNRRRSNVGTRNSLSISLQQNITDTSSEVIEVDSAAGSILGQQASGERRMARVDEAAANLEIEKAAQCTAQAAQLVAIADGLQDAAQRHLEEANELRGTLGDGSDDKGHSRKTDHGTPRE